MTSYANSSNASRLFKKRERAGYTVEEVARVLGVAEDDVNAWEQAVCQPSRDQYRMLADLLHCTPEYLFFDELLPGVSPKKGGSALKRVERELVGWRSAVPLMQILTRYQRRHFLLPKTAVTKVKVQNNVYHHLGRTTDRYRSVMRASESIDNVDASTISSRRPMDASVPGRMHLVLIDDMELVISSMALDLVETKGVPQIIMKTYTQLVDPGHLPAMWQLCVHGMIQWWDCRGIGLTGKAAPKRAGTTNVYELKQKER